MALFTIISPLYHPSRLARQQRQYQRIKETAGDLVEVLGACDNPLLHNQMGCDRVVKIPKRIGFSHAVNAAVPFVQTDVVGFLDDSAWPAVSDWAQQAYALFTKHFPDGQGLLEYSGVPDCWSRGLTTIPFAGSFNRGQLLWGEYLHCGDEDLYEQAKERFYCAPDILVQETKYDDAVRGYILDATILHDWPIFSMRKDQGFPQHKQEDWEQRLRAFGKLQSSYRELIKNILSFSQEEVTCV